MFVFLYSSASLTVQSSFEIYLHYSHFHENVANYSVYIAYMNTAYFQWKCVHLLKNWYLYRYTDEWICNSETLMDQYKRFLRFFDVTVIRHKHIDRFMYWIMDTKIPIMYMYTFFKKESTSNFKTIPSTNASSCKKKQ